MTTKKKVIKSYKGFHKDMTCRGFQYEEGKEYTTDKEISLCHEGFHACKNPIDCLNYYEPNHSVYHEVEQSGQTLSSRFDHPDTKTVSSKIKIGKRLSMVEFAKAVMDYTKSKIKHKNDYIKDYGFYKTAEQCANIKTSSSHSYMHTLGDKSTCIVDGLQDIARNSGHYGASISLNKNNTSCNEGRFGAAIAIEHESIACTTGIYSASVNTGNNGISTSTNSCSISSVTGDYSYSECDGDFSISAVTSNYSSSNASGVQSISAVSGDDSMSSASGLGSVAVTTGNSSHVIAKHETSVAIVWGPNGVAKGVKGSRLVLTEWEFTGVEIFNLIGSKMIRIDGKRYKEDTWYMLENGKVVESKFDIDNE